MKITSEFSGIAKDIMKSLEEPIKNAVMNGSEAAVTVSPVDTGRFKANWHISTNEESFSSFKSEDIDGSATLNSMVGAIRNSDLSNTKSFFIQNNAESDDGEFYAETVRYDYSGASANSMLDQIEEKISTLLL